MSDFALTSLVLTVAGSALGGLVRYWMSAWIAARWGRDFPLGTMAVNISGALGIGVFAFLPWQEWLPGGSGESLRIFAMYGFLGGFTTVSSFSLETLSLVQKGEVQKAVWNMVLSLGLCLAAVAAGATLARLWI